MTLIAGPWGPHQGFASGLQCGKNTQQLILLKMKYSFFKINPISFICIVAEIVPVVFLLFWKETY